MDYEWWYVEVLKDAGTRYGQFISDAGLMWHCFIIFLRMLILDNIFLSKITNWIMYSTFDTIINLYPFRYTVQEYNYNYISLWWNDGCQLIKMVKVNQFLAHLLTLSVVTTLDQKTLSFCNPVRVQLWLVGTPMQLRHFEPALFPVINSFAVLIVFPPWHSPPAQPQQFLLTNSPHLSFAYCF